METHAFLFNLVVFLAAAVVAVPLFRKLGLGSILGYLAAGSLLGPWGLGVTRDVKSIMSFAEFGVVLLLFIIGLELQPSRLWVMRRGIFGMGTAQMGLTALVLSTIAHLFGVPNGAAIVAGVGLALSSTAFTLQLLAEKGQLNTSFGRASFAILIFQDIAVIPFLAIVPLLAGQTADAHPFTWLSAGKMVAAIVVILVGGRYLIRPLLRTAATVRAKEVFTGATLLVVVGTGLLAEWVGMSMALGTFLAGVLLADSEYRHELEADIEPFKGLLLGLYFMAIGMAVDYGLILKYPGTLAAIVVAFMVVKYAVVYAIGRAAKFSHESARNMAIVLPQGGEFAFVLFGAAVQSQVMSTEMAGILVAAVTVSMALTPLLFTVNEKFLCKRMNINKPFDKMPTDHRPVIVAGFGRVGQVVGRILRVQNIGFTALELDAEQVGLVRRFGNEIFYGDASRLDLLESAGAANAKVFVLAIDDVEASLKTARAVRKHFPHLKILARARNRTHVYELMTIGVQVINRETFASSLELTEDLLVELGMSSEKARIVTLKFRGHDERMLLEQHRLRGSETDMINFSKQATQQLVELFRADQRPE